MPVSNNSGLFSVAAASCAGSGCATSVFTSALASCLTSALISCAGWGAGATVGTGVGLTSSSKAPVDTAAGMNAALWKVVFWAASALKLSVLSTVCVVVVGAEVPIICWQPSS